MSQPDPLLAIDGLSIGFSRSRRAPAVATACIDIDLRIDAGQVVGLVGGSGSGKTMTALAVCGLLPPGGRVVNGSVKFMGEDLVGTAERRMRDLRGHAIGLVFQDAGRALDPVHTVGHHLREASDPGVDPADLLDHVGLERSLVRRYPHQLSGGQRQRVMIAVATARNPRLLLADEPTSSLDAIVQVHVLRELVRVQRELGCGMLLISHDLGVISRVADEVVVLDHGRVVERGPTARLLSRPQNANARSLVACDVHDSVASGPPDHGRETDLLRLEAVTKSYGRRPPNPAVSEVTLQLEPGETLAVVGESGSGKSTLARLAAFILVPDQGTVTIDGTDPRRLTRRLRRRLRPRVQMAHQDVSGALDPRQRVGEIIAEPLRNQRVGRRERSAQVVAMMQAVELPGDILNRRPTQLSGGQRQRVVLARTLVMQPRYLLLDEPISALDSALVAGIVDLLRALQQSRRHGCLLISHDLTVVGSLADRVAVMYAGRIIEAGPVAEVLHGPRHPYTQALSAATLTPDVDAGLPDIGPLNAPVDSGCRYATRCAHATERCRDVEPPLLPVDGNSLVRCWLFE